MNNKNYPFDQVQQKMTCVLKTSSRNTTSCPKHSTKTPNLSRTPAVPSLNGSMQHQQDT